MTRRDLLRASAAASLAFAKPAFAQSYAPSWSSLDQRTMPEWFTRAKFGVFIHWGLYSVPSFAAVGAKNQNPYAEWYWNSLDRGKRAKAATDEGAATWEFHKRVYGADFTYPQFAPMFRAELFDPDHWADVLYRSGAKYVVPTSKHHEGFALWPSAEASRTWQRPWNSMEVGPKRDLLGELTTAVRKRDVKMGFYYSLYEWFNPLWLSDRKRFVSEHLFPQFKDVVTKYEPAIIFSDGEWEIDSSEWHSPELLAWLFNESPVKDSVVINDRWGKETRHKHGGYYTTEYTSGMQGGKQTWEEDRGMGYSFGYNRMETLKDYRTERELILMLTDTVSRGGNLLLDIGPTADGRIPVLMEERLLQIGNWLSLNGEAIYDTTPWTTSRQWGAGNVPKFEEKQYMGEYNLPALVDTPASGNARIDGFFTNKGDAVYMILPRWPASLTVDIPHRGGSAVKAELVETKQPLGVTKSGAGISIQLPSLAAANLKSREAYSLKITGL